MSIETNHKESQEWLSGHMRLYTTSNLRGITPADFKKRIDEFLAMNDYEMEGLPGPENQRDQMVKFQWGHTHDFGTFRVGGMMGDRHIKVMARMIDAGYLSRDLTEKCILEVGPWTGGMSLLLAAMGAEVVAVEEVRKYADSLNFLAKSFGITIACTARSVYDLRYSGVFDHVFISGVLYHISDPVVALRRCFDALAVGGTLLLETMVCASNEPIMWYIGPSVVASGTKERMNRTGWNWYSPSPRAVKKMLHDVGFEKIQILKPEGDRLIATAKKERQVPICRAGLNYR